MGALAGDGTDRTTLSIPELALVVLVGPDGPHRKALAGRFDAGSIVELAAAERLLNLPQEGGRAGARDAFDLACRAVSRRLQRGLLTVVDAPNACTEERACWLRLAKEHDVAALALVLDIPSAAVSGSALEQWKALSQVGSTIEQTGFDEVCWLRGPTSVEELQLRYERLTCNLREEDGPFDIIGDVHGCLAELRRLLDQLGYVENEEGFSHPQGRRAVFLGDLADRGPDIPGVFRLAIDMVGRGQAFCVAGNHDIKLLRKLQGRDVRMTNGLQRSVDQLEQVDEVFRATVVDFLSNLASHYVLAGGRLVVAHAGLPEAQQGRQSKRERALAIWGENTGELDAYGLPIRRVWAKDYGGDALVVFGHTPVAEPVWLNGTVNIDTGCVFGGRLSALRYPECEICAVPAAEAYYHSPRPFFSSLLGF